MAEKRYGKVIARGSDSFVAQVGVALQEARQGQKLPKPLEDLLPRDYAIEEHTRDEFRQAGYTVPGGLAEGYVVDRDTLWVRRDVAERKPPRAKHIERHEIAHAIAATYLSAPRKMELLAIMDFEDGTHPKKWIQGGYWARPSECYADKFSVAISGKDSPWDQFDDYRLDIKPMHYARLIEITFRRDDLPPDPEPVPVPLPIPDPRIPVLEAQVNTLQMQLDAEKLAHAETQAALATAGARIMAKDQKMTEGLAI